MMDLLPFLRITESKPENQIAEIVNYLTQFKETLEFVLMNISDENLSPDLVNKLNKLGADIEKSNTTREEEIAQVASSALTLSDVCNSDMFKSAVKLAVASYALFRVNAVMGNLEYHTATDYILCEINTGTGHLDYTTETCDISFSVNFDTGYIEYATQ